MNFSEPPAWCSLSRMFVIARIATAGFFLAHAVMRIVYGTIPQFGQFMEGLGFPAGVACVWAITVTELIAGVMLIAGWRVQIATAALAAIAAGGIVLIHMHLGWFVGEHGTGGMEYSVALLVLLALITAEANARARAADSDPQ
ncbi:MAG: DoxX family protein [Pseudomonadota bacterium]